MNRIESISPAIGSIDHTRRMVQPNDPHFGSPLLSKEANKKSEKLCPFAEWQKCSFALNSFVVNPLNNGELFRCLMLDESICHFRGVRSILSPLFYF